MLRKPTHQQRGKWLGWGERWWRWVDGGGGRACVGFIYFIYFVYFIYIIFIHILYFYLFICFVYFIYLYVLYYIYIYIYIYIFILFKYPNNFRCHFGSSLSLPWVLAASLSEAVTVVASLCAESGCKSLQNTIRSPPLDVSVWCRSRAEDCDADGARGRGGCWLPWNEMWQRRLAWPSRWEGGWSLRAAPRLDLPVCCLDRDSGWSLRRWSTLISLVASRILVEASSVWFYATLVLWGACRSEVGWC